jgi:hypothetical protein
VQRAIITSLAVVIALASGCSDDDATDDANVDAQSASREVPTEPTVSTPVDDTPFCRAMLEVDASQGALGDIIPIYVDVSDEVPSEIRPDFDVVLERMIAISRGEEVADPVRAEESAIELAGYIERRCRGTSVNPLPPPTAPHDAER